MYTAKRAEALFINRGGKGLANIVRKLDLVEKFDRNGAGNNAALYPSLEKKANSLPAAVAVVEGPVIDIHAHEGVSLGSFEATSILHRVIKRPFSML